MKIEGELKGNNIQGESNIETVVLHYRLRLFSFKAGFEMGKT